MPRHKKMRTVKGHIEQYKSKLKKMSMFDKGYYNIKRKLRNAERRMQVLVGNNTENG